MSTSAAEVAAQIAQQGPSNQQQAPAEPARDWLGGGGGTDVGDFERLLEHHGDDVDAFDSDAQPSAPATASSEPSESASAAAKEGDEGAVTGDDTEQDAASADDASDDQDATGQDADDDGLEAAEVAEVLGLGEDQIVISDEGELLLRVKVDGEVAEVTPQSLVRGYQLEQHTTRKAEQLGEERRQAAAHFEQREAELNQTVETALATAQALKGRILAEYEGTDWNALERENPGLYAAKQLQMSTRMSGIDTEVTGLLGQVEQVKQRQAAEQRAAHDQWLEQQRTQLFEQVPELADPTERPKVLEAWHTHLEGYGFRDEEIRGVHDARMLRHINDAVRTKKLYEELKAQLGKGETNTPEAAAALKKVTRTPRIRLKGKGKATPGAQPQAQAASQRTKSLKRLRATGSDNDAVNFALDSNLVDSML